MSDAERLAAYVDIWWQAVQDFLALCATVPADRWATPTDLPGWDVHDVVAHTAHLEAILAGAPEETLELEPPPHVRGLMGLYTEQGVRARQDRAPAELLGEIRDSTSRRHAALLADPPGDASARPPVIFGGVPWDWDRLLRNRPLDVWMHEQDIRRALDLPGGMDSPAARLTADYLAESLPMVLAKRVGAAAGTTAVLQVEGSPVLVARVGPDGRGSLSTEVPDPPTVRLRTDRETFVLLAGGRRPAPDGAVTVEGDTDLGSRIIAALAVTP